MRFASHDANEGDHGAIMRVHWLLFFAAALGACQGSSSDAAQQPEFASKRAGWGAVPWGSSPDNARRLAGFPLGPVETDKKEEDGEVFYRMVGKFDAKNRSYTVRFFFGPDRLLRGVNMSPLPEGAGCSAVNDELLAVYGPPLDTDREKDLDLTTRSWRSEGTIVSFLHDKPQEGSTLKDFCAISYEPVPDRAATGL